MRVTTVLWIAAVLAAGAISYGQVKPRLAGWLDDPPALHPDDPRMTTGDSSIVMLSAEWCGYCLKQRKAFEMANVRYHLLDVDTPEGDRAMQALQTGGVPVTIVGQDVIYGYQPEAVKTRLAPLGYRL
ncbi:glutaredoxin domain-containing protein [Thermomonas sp. HDW16]|uniref:glutaredoxin family protein n=1 Tax=Thermomonas sp. HDW16 TaxID=2714945 RepID=UPI0014086E79|nr:glutaredoxin domain-containing protein [Thermomonas sp. HDW16]QIL21235.1 glutaredoxin family protein [Thermomonas sp. HDW16]